MVDDSASERDSIDTETEDAIGPQLLCVQYASSSGVRGGRSNSVIRIDGEDCGVYNISDESLEPRSEGDCNSSATRPEIETDDVDDGYRSLSRDSFRCGLMQQLADIRLRLIDLIDEIEHGVESRGLKQEEMQSYKRRRDALIKKIDFLISKLVKRPVGHHHCGDSIDNSSSSAADDQPASSYDKLHANTRADSETKVTCSGNKSDTSDGYEEQVHVINYNFSSQVGDIHHDSTSTEDVSVSSQRPLVDSSEMTRINVVATRHNAYYPTTLDKSRSFGNMEECKSNSQVERLKIIKTKHETRQKKPYDNDSQTRSLEKKTIMQHNPTSSSTSNYSASSYASSSSSSFL